MDIIINEQSLDGQFETVDDFLESLVPMLKIHKLIEETDNVALLRHHELYMRSVTQRDTLYDVMKDNRSRTSSEIRAFKQIIQKLTSEEPFWSLSPLHSNRDHYVHLGHASLPPYGHCLAEACERDRIVISFQHNSYKEDSLEILKNNSSIVIINITDQIQLSELLLENQLITHSSYCKFRFDPRKLAFNLLDIEFGFDTLERDELKAFISSFKTFYELSWDEIVKSDGLQYKAYSPSSKEDDWFRHSSHESKNIYKFRVSSKYRCFGIREGDTFFVLRFETTHKHSDKG